MLALDIIKAPIVSVTDLKKNPAKINARSEATGSGVYIFSNNKPLSVIVTPEIYSDLIAAKEELIRREEEEMWRSLNAPDAKFLATREEMRQASQELFDEVEAEDALMERE